MTRRIAFLVLIAAAFMAAMVAVICWRSGFHPEDKLPAQIRFSDLSKVQVIGRTGVPLGELTTIVGIVTKASSGHFEVEVDLDGGEKAEFYCEIWSHPAPPIPKEGNTVRVTGYETLEQRGSHDSESKYRMTRDDILASISGGQVRDIPGGDGRLRFITTFKVYDIPASLGPEEGNAENSQED